MRPCTVPFAECITASLIALQRVFGVRFCRVESIESLRQEPDGLRLTLQPHTDHKPRPELVSNGPQHPLAKDRIYPHITGLATSIRVKVHVAEQRIRIFATRCPRLDNRAGQQTYLAPESSFVLVGRVGVPHSRRWKLESLSGRVLNSAVWRSPGGRPQRYHQGIDRRCVSVRPDWDGQTGTGQPSQRSSCTAASVEPLSDCALLTRSLIESPQIRAVSVAHNIAWGRPADAVGSQPLQ